MGSELRWLIVAVLLGLAAATIYVVRRRLVLLAAALLIAPAPALLVLRLTIPMREGAPDDQAGAGLLLSVVACYLAPALGALTAHLVSLRTRAEDVRSEPAIDGDQAPG